MNTDLTRVERTVLNTFDLLGKVGGVYGLLANIAVTFLSFINFQKKENILVSKLFSKSNKAITSSSKFACKELLQSILPDCCLLHCCKCLTPNRRDVFFDKGRTLMKQR